MNDLPSPPPSLPDLPPEVFQALQGVERGLEKAVMTRAEHVETERCLRAVFQFCLQGNAVLKSHVPLTPLTPPA